MSDTTIMIALSLIGVFALFPVLLAFVAVRSAIKYKKLYKSAMMYNDMKLKHKTVECMYWERILHVVGEFLEKVFKESSDINISYSNMLILKNVIENLIDSDECSKSVYDAINSSMHIRPETVDKALRYAMTDYFAYYKMDDSLVNMLMDELKFIQKEYSDANYDANIALYVALNSVTKAQFQIEKQYDDFRDPNKQKIEPVMDPATMTPKDYFEKLVKIVNEVDQKITDGVIVIEETPLDQSAEVVS